MSQENVEIVRNVYQALNRRDWDTAFRDMHPDFELTTQLGPNSGTRRGRERVTEFFEDYLATFDAFIWEPEKFFEGDDQVVAFVRTRALPRGGSVDLVVRNGWWWTIRDGVILSVKSSPNQIEPSKPPGCRSTNTLEGRTSHLRPAPRARAEGEGFEPSRDLTAPNGFRDDR
jgi:ketosteroid isomerase-like protein